MHSFATIEEFARFDTVTYYTVRGEDAKLSETDDFFRRIEKEAAYGNQLEHLLFWLEDIGNDKKGAAFDLFRQGGIALRCRQREGFWMPLSI